MNTSKVTQKIILALLLSAISFGTFFYFPYASLKTISDHGATIRYSKYLNHQIIPSTTNNYRNHQFQISETGDRSRIEISIPVKETSNEVSPGIAEFFGLDEVTIMESVMNGVRGQKTQRRLLPTPDDNFTPAMVYYELYPSTFLSSPLLITYYKVDGTRGLEKELEIIKKYLRWR